MGDASKLTVSLVTPLRDVLRAEVDQVTAPSVLGEVGIGPDHLPLLADLQEGSVGLYRAGRMEKYAVSGGFVEVERNTVTILAETAERADEIDVKRSKRALENAEERLKTLEYGDPEFFEQQARIRRSRVRLHVAGSAD